MADPVETFLNRGAMPQVCLVHGDLVLAEPAALRIAQALAEAAGLPSGAAEVHRRAGRLDAAVRHLEAAVELDPGGRDSRALLALLRAESPGEGSGVMRLLRDDTFATVAFGSLCLEQGLADEAALVFTRVLRRHPDDPGARTRLELALRARSRRRG